MWIALVTFFIIDCVFGVMLSQSCKIGYNVAILGGGGGGPIAIWEAKQCKFINPQ